MVNFLSTFGIKENMESDIIIGLVILGIAGAIAGLLKIFKMRIMNKWRSFWQNKEKRKARKKHAKEENNLKAELWEIIQFFKPIFNLEDNNCSFSDFFMQAEMDPERFITKVVILESWFSFFVKRFHDSNNPKVLSDELVCIIRSWEEIYKDFRREINGEKLRVESWNQLKERYNHAINQLESFFKKASKKSDIEPYTFRFLNDIK